MTFRDKAEIKQKCILFLFHIEADFYQNTWMHLEKEFKNGDGPSNVPVSLNITWPIIFPLVFEMK